MGYHSNMSYRVEEYLREDHDNKVQNGTGKPFQRQMVPGIGEYRLDWGPGYRVYIGRDGERLIILLGGGTKKVNRRI